MNCAHMAILQRSDTLQLSESGRGRVSFQNGRKHIVISLRTDLQWITETGRAGTESREPTHGPARSPSAHRREGRHHRPLTHGNKKPGSNTHQWPHRSAATGSLPHGKGGGMGRQTPLGAQTRTMQRRPVRRTPKMPLEEKTPGLQGAQRPAPFPTGRAGGRVDKRTLEPRHGQRNGPPLHEDIKKAPGGTTSEGSKGRRLPTLPPLLGQYHRHKCV